MSAEVIKCFDIVMKQLDQMIKKLENNLGKKPTASEFDDLRRLYGKAN